LKMKNLSTLSIRATALLDRLRSQALPASTLLKRLKLPLSFNHPKLITSLSTTLNKITGFGTSPILTPDQISLLKDRVVSLESKLSLHRHATAQAKQNYDSLLAQHSSTSSQLSTLLSRKSVWNSTDAEAFTRLFVQDQSLSARVLESQTLVRDSESSLDRSLESFLDAMRERYAGEQIWADKLRSLSTYWTW
jgi:hypothetical protein